MALSAGCWEEARSHRPESTLPVLPTAGLCVNQLSRLQNTAPSSHSLKAVRFIRLEVPGDSTNGQLLQGGNITEEDPAEQDCLTHGA